ncbi:tRNA-binding protein [Bacillus sp. MUM 116]|uniref:tRNA-binding protein n=1 Tax=Bacillus sp. MUM 116 TaxID=1678002 RepID=UPI000AB48E4E|nr:tRNA-binding protein [Bacillus sp. MUM 116]
MEASPLSFLLIDFGEEIGIKQSSVQITDCYGLDELVGKQVLGVVNFLPMKVADYSSEVLVMGVYSEQGVVLIEPQQKVKKGDRLG